MKSFGVRLAAGAVTILFGAYAAAIAQKDKQDSSDSWNAEAPSLGEPAMPIASVEDGSWLSQPESQLSRQESALELAEAPSPGVTDADSPVQLVQHTEPVGEAPSGGPSFEPSMLPSSLGAPEATGTATNADSAAVADDQSWMLPPSESAAATAAADGVSAGDVSEGADQPAMTMSFPGAGFDPSAAGAPSVGDPSPNVVPEVQLAEVPEMEFFAAESGGPTEPNSADPPSSGVGSVMSEFDAAASIPSGDTSDPFQSPDAGPAMTSGSVSGMTPPSAESSAIESQGPTNLLRSGDSSANVLRSGVDAATVAGAVVGGAVAGAALSDDTGGPRSMQFPTGTPASYGAMPTGETFATDAATQDPAANKTAGTESYADAPTAGIGIPESTAMGIQADPVSGFPAPQSTPPATGVTSSPAFNGGYGTAASEGAAAPDVAPAMGVGQNTIAPPERMASLQQQGVGTPAGYANQPTGMAPPNTAMAIDPNATIDAPGERRLEGAQTPSVIIQKRAPAEVKVGKPASFVIHVQNVGAVEALDVEVHDRVPAGMRLVDVSPKPIQQGNMLMWQLGAMPAGDERTVTMQLIPEQEGELGSVARVSFEAAASVRTIATRPELKIVQRAPETVLIGQQLEIELEVSNPGTGEASNVVLQEDVPEGLEHPKGRQLDNALGSLAPGEVRNQVLRLRAIKPGIIQNTIRLTGEDSLTADHTVTVQVVSPDLKVALEGPSRRFLERQATYQLKVANEGTADATNIEISVQLDRGFKFVSTDYEGQYDPSRHSVFWSLASLPAGGNGSVPLTLLPVEPGEQAIKINASADLGMVANSERTMTVEGFAELDFEISNRSGPIEVGAETSYEIRVSNSGSKADSNIRVQLQLPQGLELISADGGEAGTDGKGLVAFQPKNTLAPGEDLKYGLRVRGTAAGTHIVRAVVVSDHRTVPVTKEESTVVYSDQ